MSKFTRRNFLKASGGAAVAASAMSVSPFAIGGAAKKVVVVGGGMGGATAAKYIRMMDSSIDVTLIEANKDYYTCFMSNEVIGGSRDINSIKFGYTGLGKHGVNVVNDMVTGIDAGRNGMMATRLMPISVLVFGYHLWGWPASRFGLLRASVRIF